MQPCGVPNSTSKWNPLEYFPSADLGLFPHLALKICQLCCLASHLSIWTSKSGHKHWSLSSYFPLFLTPLPSRLIVYHTSRISKVRAFLSTNYNSDSPLSLCCLRMFRKGVRLQLLLHCISEGLPALWRLPSLLSHSSFWEDERASVMWASRKHLMGAYAWR